MLARFQSTSVRPSTPEHALVELAHLLYQWRRLLLADPGLPTNLLPPQWSGEQARRLLLDRHRRWRQMARTWWQGRRRRSSAGVIHGYSARAGSQTC